VALQLTELSPADVAWDGPGTLAARFHPPVDRMSAIATCVPDLVV